MVRRALRIMIMIIRLITVGANLVRCVICADISIIFSDTMYEYH